MPRQHVDSARAATGWVVALVLWTCFMWGNSMVPGPASDANSYAVVGVLADLFRAFGVTDPELMNMVVRKSAHFLEFALEGFLAYRALGARQDVPVRGVLVAVAVGVMAAAADECIQLFVPNRAGMVEDVLLDSLGVVAGVHVARLVTRRKGDARA